MEEKKERLDGVLKWAIWIYFPLCLLGIYAKEVTALGGLFPFLHALTFSTCMDFTLPYGKPYFKCTGSFYEFLLLFALVLVRYIISGKTYQK